MGDPNSSCPICGKPFHRWHEHRCSQKACAAIDGAHNRESDGLIDQTVRAPRPYVERLKDGFLLIDGEETNDDPS